MNTAESQNRPTAAEDARKALIERVLASPAFQRSPRSSELLVYLCERSLGADRSGIPEHQIAVDFFGRKPGYNASDDTIVRVQVSQLRKKLHAFFLEEGRNESTVIQIPPGSYVPVFQSRRQETAQIVPVPAETKPALSKWRPGLLILCLSSSVLTSIWLLRENYTLRQATSAPVATTTALDRLWNGIFRRDRPIQVVLSDSSLMELSDFIGRRITLGEYRDRYFPRALLEKTVPDPVRFKLADKMIGHVYTTLQDADAAWRIGRLTRRYQFSAHVISARDFRMVPDSDSDLILLGHTKSNPWMELFEDQMNFRYLLPSDGIARLVNTHPLQGELPEYKLDHPHVGYCVVAYQSKPMGSGNALLLLATDMTSVEAGLRLISDNTETSEMLRRLGVLKAGALPHFEFLVRVKLLVNVAPGFEFVAQRISPQSR